MSGGDLLIGGRWEAGRGAPLQSGEPAGGAVVWSGRAADGQQVHAAVAAARAAAPAWAAMPVEHRRAILQRFAELLQQQSEAMALLISREIGKPRWESRSEVKVMIDKVAVSFEAWQERRRPSTRELPGMSGATIYKPHGVVAVFGPFNLPGHLPNGHIVPALIAGNTVLFKPSERAPGVAALYAALWSQAGLPDGVFNLLQGGREVGEALAQHPQIDGLFFTGGCAAGLALARTLAQQPQKILALEMGGNNPLIVHDVADADAAAYMTILSAYITAGQRCTCARRLIVPRSAGNDRFLNTLRQRLAGLSVGPYTQQPEPFMGPVISDKTAKKLLAAQSDWLSRGGQAIVPMRQIDTATLTPGLIDVTACGDLPDEEHFGPLLQVIRVDDFDEAIERGNATRFGLSAGLLSDSHEHFDRFLAHARAGVITWNRQTTGASGYLPFGGIGLSGNHRPSGYWAADYCSYPVAVMHSATLSMPKTLLPGMAWK